MNHNLYDYRISKKEWPWIIVERWKLDNSNHALKFYTYDRKIRMKQVTFDRNYIFDNDDLNVRHYKHK